MKKRNNGKWKPMKENSDIFPTYVCWLALPAVWSKVGSIDSTIYAVLSQVLDPVEHAGLLARNNKMSYGTFIN